MAIDPELYEGVDPRRAMYGIVSLHFYRPTPDCLISEIELSDLLAVVGTPANNLQQAYDRRELSAFDLKRAADDMLLGRFEENWPNYL